MISFHTRKALYDLALIAQSFEEYKTFIKIRFGYFNDIDQALLSAIYNKVKNPITIAEKIWTKQS